MSGAAPAANSREQRAAGEERWRLFFALWPDRAVQAALAAVGKEVASFCKGRLIPRDKLHMTLAFLGLADRAQLEALRGLSGGILSPSCELVLGRLSCWDRKGIAWLGMDEVPNAITDLVTRLRTMLRGAGFVPEERAFAPHVTLMRHARCRLPEHQAIRPVVWPVSEFVLVRSTLDPDGAAYQIIGRWPLSAHAPG
ncbi:MAG: RNA 2',3'-cyclic phosphodiesterase [Betaproteobacteria bacterium]|nr:RNA 2',3'-cyclic phosphodiesterase [Betaproteobacteria bacterium]